MSGTIFNISDDMAALERLLWESGGDITGDAETAVAAWEAELAANLYAKLDAYGGLISEIEARAAARRAEATRILDLAKADEKAAANLRERLRFVFETRALGKVETPRYRFSLVQNGGKLPIDIHGDLESLPSWAVRRETMVYADKDAIRARLETGEQLPFATLMDRGTRIAIK
jgi:hypothetical protein